jgi:alpha/beta superfamily hydrolase
VGLFGYSFGAGVALRAATESTPAACSVLAPPGETGVVEALESLSCPLQVVYGDRDETVGWKPVVARACELDAEIESLPADHHFVGQFDRVGSLVATFLRARL